MKSQFWCLRSPGSVRLATRNYLKPTMTALALAALATLSGQVYAQGQQDDSVDNSANAGALVGGFVRALIGGGQPAAQPQPVVEVAPAQEVVFVEREPIFIPRREGESEREFAERRRAFDDTHQHWEQRRQAAEVQHREAEQRRNAEAQHREAEQRRTAEAQHREAEQRRDGDVQRSDLRANNQHSQDMRQGNGAPSAPAQQMQTGSRPTQATRSVPAQTAQPAQAQTARQAPAQAAPAHPARPKKDE